MTATKQQKTKWEPSAYQVAIFDWVQNGTGNLVVNAMPGSGKTTTTLEACNYIPKTQDVVAVAFNKHIADTFHRKGLPSHVQASTLHSLGLAAIKRAFPQIKVDKDKLTKIVKLHFDLDNRHDRNRYYKGNGVICRIISLLKAMLLEPTDDNIVALAYEFNLSDCLEYTSIIRESYHQSIEQLNTVDFDDMVFLPVHLNLPLRKFDFIFVDEAQDLNFGQIEFIYRLATSPDTGEFRSRVVLVGDRHQAIYAWRGADSAAMDRLKEHFQATELPLSISWRCPTEVVKLAHQTVPQIEAAPNAKEGLVKTIDVTEFEEILTEQDPSECLVLCRTNAPIVGMCLRLIRMGVPATVIGRFDVGANVVKTFKKLLAKFHKETDEDGYNYLTTWIAAERDLQVAKFQSPEFSGIRINTADTYDTINYFLEDIDLHKVDDLGAAFERRINEVFSEDKRAYQLSTIHKAKGLEAEHVFFYLPEMIPHPMARGKVALEQEYNLQFVAQTRSSNALYLVSLVQE